MASKPPRLRPKAADPGEENWPERIIAAKQLRGILGGATGICQLRNVDMTVTISGYDMVGDYIILPNLLSEPKIAAS